MQRLILISLRTLSCERIIAALIGLTTWFYKWSGAAACMHNMYVDMYPYFLM